MSNLDHSKPWGKPSPHPYLALRPVSAPGHSVPLFPSSSLHLVRRSLARGDRSCDQLQLQTTRDCGLVASCSGPPEFCACTATRFCFRIKSIQPEIWYALGEFPVRPVASWEEIQKHVLLYFSITGWFNSHHQQSTSAGEDIFSVCYQYCIF